MSNVRLYLQTRRKELKEKLQDLAPLQAELADVEKSLAAIEPTPTCKGCYYVPRDSRDGPPGGGCDECRQGPYYR